MFVHNSAFSRIVTQTVIHYNDLYSYLLFLKIRLNKQQTNVNVSPQVDSVIRTVTIGIEYVLMMTWGTPSEGIPSVKKQN